MGNQNACFRDMNIYDLITEIKLIIFKQHIRETLKNNIIYLNMFKIMKKSLRRINLFSLI